MKKKSGLTKVLRIILGLSILLTLFFQFIKPSQVYESFDLSLYTFTSYIKYALFQSPAQSLSDAVDGYTSLHLSQKENAVLKQNLSEVNQLQTQLIEANKEITELKDLLDLKQTLTSVENISANVIEKDSTNFNNSLLLNVGTNDGVGLYMAVVTPSGLIGQITQVNDNSSVVKLLTSQEGKNAFALKVQLDSQNSVEALLEGYDVDTKEYIVRLLDSTQNIKENMKVVTSGLGEIVPGGLLVGDVVSFESSPATLSVILRVKPAASFSNINAVTVVSKP